MAQVKKYPRDGLVKMKTTTVLGCAKCAGQIKMNEEHWRDNNAKVHYHDGCLPHNATTDRRIWSDKK